MMENCWQCYISCSFLDLLLGRDVTLITVYKPLTFAMTNMSSTMSRCQIRQLNNISQFSQSFTHITEIHSLVVDTLSCLEINTSQVSDFGINCKQFTFDQQTDAAGLQLKNQFGGLQINPIRTGLFLLCMSGGGGGGRFNLSTLAANNF